MIAVDDRVRKALEKGHRIDITTTGRKSGAPRRIELVFHNIDGHIYISGRPGWPRGWIANLRADPRMTFHLKHGSPPTCRRPGESSSTARSGSASSGASRRAGATTRP